ncbi:MAG: low molecular weight phosphotyrosine protein phosphatase [Anaerolineae bacterium]
MPNILVVCTANICRSPVGEAILRARLQERGLHNWRVSSAGTWAMIERRAARFSREILAEQGLDLSAHQARMIDEHMLAKADLVLCMESGHVEALQTEFPAHAKKLYLLSEMVGRKYSISDPYGQPRDAYERMVKELTSLIDDGLDRIVAIVEANHTGMQRV